LEDQVLRDQCLELGLDPGIILKHKLRVERAIAHGSPQKLEIIDTCRVDNGGILKYNLLNCLQGNLDSFVAFVPAAGASSRYFKEFHQLEKFARTGDIDGARKECRTLFESGLEDISLPPYLKKVLEGDCSSSNLAEIQNELLLPKAFLPCVRENKTYLDMKTMEHKKLGIGQIFVGAERFRELFERFIKDSNVESSFFIQGGMESTIRFGKNGAPLLGDDGRLSVVPAGHGTLVRLISKANLRFKNTESVFIRNIDNIMGTGGEAVEATERFLRFHKGLLNHIAKIRQNIDSGHLKIAGEEAQVLLALLKPAQLQPEQIDFLESKSGNRPLWELQCSLFGYFPQAKEGEESDISELTKLYKRPVVTLGQVKNDGTDVGGTPVFVRSDLGTLRICLEVPHATPKDAKEFLRNPERATHFNPVFVAAEINFDPDHFDESVESPFWVLSKRSFQGQEVFYHESVLYELIGNSFLTNSVFVEVPRILFNPHKSVRDTKGKSLAHWLPAY